MVSYVIGVMMDPRLLGYITFHCNKRVLQSHWVFGPSHQNGARMGNVDRCCSASKKGVQDQCISKTTTYFFGLRLVRAHTSGKANKCARNLELKKVDS
jgi:hypothetical protein